MNFKLRDRLRTAVCSSKVCLSCYGLLQLWASLFYQEWLNCNIVRIIIQWVWVKYRNFCIRPTLQSLFTYNWELTSENWVTVGLTLKEGCSLKVYKITKLQEVITTLSVALLFHSYFAPKSLNILTHLT
jgi:hypothetical protein